MAYSIPEGRQPRASPWERGMQQKIAEKVREAIQSVLPLVAVVLILQLAVVQAPLAFFLQFLAGAVLATAGIALLLLGVELGILPMGRFIGAELPRTSSILLIIAVAFALGFATTVAEPDVLILGEQVDQVSRGAISGMAVVYVMALGVAIFTALASLRIIFGWSMRNLVLCAYGLVLLLSLVTPEEFVSLAFDAGSVTTGVLTAPVLIAIAMGLSTVLAGRSAVGDGFGISGFASVGAILFVLVMGMLWI